MVVIIWILFAISCLLIVISTIMSPDSNSFSGALVGSSDLTLFKTKKEIASKIFLKRLMFLLGFSLMMGSIIIRTYM